VFSDQTAADDLAYAACVCKCANCKRLADCAAQKLQATLMFNTALELITSTAVLTLSTDADGFFASQK
jgi:hypothetical protein